ncbi:TetR/AcrR family transcriptional regulator [Mycolicibacterium hodleri]|uniref:TetR/AcrR family transcriptional regulator n=1 Tax=Mycolicibacterium hodleri TaxID=49897 RepID=A0A502E594_9MYCO|nr:TetR/AcrR family transcriptional regulator [Mycolicibacterium hodleri]TPG32514.1 TetR/AcrR family transcriptional regulator [Mycolicibacterium hodleri]
MVSDVPSDSAADAPPSASRWTARESEFLAVTLRLLQEHGYDRLTLEAVATEAKASKATMYRRWPSKAELVIAAFIEGTRVSAIAPRTGSLRADLLEIGAQVCEQADEHAATMRAVLTEMSRIPELSAAMQDEFVHQRKSLMTQVLTEAVNRGDIDAAVISDEIWDLLPGYLVFRCVMPGRPPGPETVRLLVDEVLMPSLTRDMPSD